MTTKIDKRITGFSVIKAGDHTSSKVAEQATQIAIDKVIATDGIQQMNEKVERPDVLPGSTYKIKSPLVEHAMYVTITDILLNPGTEHETRRPFEVFINSKNMDHFQWIVALTRIMSAVFRKGGDVTFLVEEMKAVFDPRGGYFKSGGAYMPSIVAEIGYVIETHLKSIGLIRVSELDEAQKRMIADKHALIEARDKQTTSNKFESISPSGVPGATLCQKCMNVSLVRLDGCDTCVTCGYSKCG